MYSSNRPVAHLGNSAKENCAEYLITNECNGRIQKTTQLKYLNSLHLKKKVN